MLKNNFAIKCDSKKSALELCDLLKSKGYVVDEDWNKINFTQNPLGWYVLHTYSHEYGWRLGVYSHDGGYRNVSLTETLPNKEFVLPENWYIKCTDENLETLRKWSGKYYLTTDKLVGMVKWRDNGRIELGVNPKSFSKGEYAGYDFGQEITFEQFKKYVLKEEVIKSTKNQKQKEMNNQTVFSGDNEVTIVTGTGTRKSPISKEVLMTRTLKFKVENKKVETVVERDVSIAVLVIEHGDTFAGYSVRNPMYDTEFNPTLAKMVARNRAINNKTNLVRHEVITPRFQTKHVLKGIADQIFAEISKGTIKIKGVK